MIRKQTSLELMLHEQASYREWTFAYRDHAGLRCIEVHCGNVQKSFAIDIVGSNEAIVSDEGDVVSVLCVLRFGRIKVVDPQAVIRAVEAAHMALS